MLLLFAAVGLMAFTFKNVNRADLKSQLPGEWRNVYVKITVHNKNKPAPAIMEADSSNWQARLGIQPIRTHFLKDGTYYSEYRNAKDSLVRRPSGTWSLQDDSLTMTQLTPDKSVIKLQLKIVNDHATFQGRIDFDGEGISNDEYYGIQKKFK